MRTSLFACIGLMLCVGLKNTPARVRSQVREGGLPISAQGFNPANVRRSCGGGNIALG